MKSSSQEVIEGNHTVVYDFGKSGEDIRSYNRESVMPDEFELEQVGLSAHDPISLLVKRSPYQHSQDKQGHEAFLGARFPKTVRRWVQKIKELDKAEHYETEADVTRDAIHLGLLVLWMRVKSDPEWKIEDKLWQNASEAAERAQIKKRETAFVESLSALCHDGHQDAAIDDLKEHAQFINDLRDHWKCDIYKKSLQDALSNSKLGFLLEALQEW